MPDDKLFCALLKYWRGRRGLSQLDLALSAGVSARHISFLETGRSRPSEEMVLLLGNTLDLPLREQNALFRAAGFEARFSEPDFDAMRSPIIERALKQMMRQHEPFPMLILNSAYDVLAMNEGATRLLNLAAGRELGQFNAIEALFDPEQLRPIIVDWEDAAREILSRLHREVLHRPNDHRLAQVLEKALLDSGLPEEARRPDFARDSPATFPFRFRVAGMELGFLTTLMSFSAPQNVTLEELRIESYFPLDDATQAVCERLAQSV